MNGLRPAIQEHDGDGLRKIAHALKGCARTIGAIRLAELASQLEQLGVTGHGDSAQATFWTLQPELARVQKALQVEFNQKSPTLP
jgi:HPt (histidine-containing phosphotransfer) domain-containing protein